MFIKTVLEAAFGFPNLLQITKAALNHVNNIESITSNVRFEFVSFTRRVESIIVTSMVNIGALWCSSCCCTEKNQEWPGHCYHYQCGNWARTRILL